MSTEDSQTQESNANQLTVREAVEGAEIIDENECECDQLNNVGVGDELECWSCYNSNE